MPLISVIIPCWNAAPFIKTSIQSALSQAYESVEVIVVDDGSTDGSLDIIKMFDSSIRWLSVANGGACKARNAGLALATGRYIKFIDADDYISPDMISSEMNCLNNYKGFGEPLIISGSMSTDARLENPVIHWRDNLWNQPSGTPINIAMILLNTPPVGSPLYSREKLLEIGGFNTNLTNHEDDDLSFRYLTSGVIPIFSGCFGYFYRQHSAYERVSKSDLRKHVGSGLMMLQSHAAIGGVLSDRKIGNLVTETTQLRAWAYGRELLRENLKEDAVRYFAFAKSIDAICPMNGSFLYRTVATIIGPVKTENLFIVVKKLFSLFC